MRTLLLLLGLIALLGLLTPWLRRHGLGRLPGDIDLTLGGRRHHFPFASTILLSLALTALLRWL